MKNLFLLLLLLMPLQLLADEANANNDKSQQEALLQRENSASKTVGFLKSHSSFNKYEYYALPCIGKGKNMIESVVTIITNLETKDKIGCLRVSTRGLKRQYGYLLFRDKYTCVLDFEELDDIIKSCEYIQSVVLDTKAVVPTTIKFETLDGLTFGAEWIEENVLYPEDMYIGWNVYLQTYLYDSDSMAKISTKNFPLFIQNLRDAKGVILSKLK